MGALFQAFLIVATALGPTAAMLADMIPVRARGGIIYSTLLEQEAAAHKLHGIQTNSTPNYFQQLIDHNTPSRGTFNQKYYLDYTSWDPATGPVFLYIGGEGPLSNSPGGYPAVLAASQHALIVALEHRYYGESIPSPLADKDTLRTLSVESALADLAAFISFAQTAIVGDATRKWLTIGGSYPGALSAWFRITHPELVVAAWSSSGVVDAIFNFSQFDQQIAFELPPPCAAALHTVTTLAEQAWDDPTSRTRALKLFNTPDYFTREDFLWMLADSAAMGPQVRLNVYM